MNGLKVSNYDIYKIDEMRIFLSSHSELEKGSWYVTHPTRPRTLPTFPPTQAGSLQQTHLVSFKIDKVFEFVKAFKTMYAPPNTCHLRIDHLTKF